jgi:hypothetical protein
MESLCLAIGSSIQSAKYTIESTTYSENSINLCKKEEVTNDLDILLQSGSIRQSGSFLRGVFLDLNAIKGVTFDYNFPYFDFRLLHS